MEEQSSSGFKFTKKTVIGLVVLVLLVAAIPIGVYLSQQTQIFKPKAAEVKPISGPETSLTLVAPGNVEPGAEIRVGVWARSDTDAANLFVSKLKFPTDLLQVSSINANVGPLFVKNWIEKTFDNNAGTISLSGGIPSPGYKTTLGQPSGLIAEVVFKTKKAGLATISFDTDSAIYRNSDNVNVLNIKRDVSFRIENEVIPTKTPIPTPTSGATSNRVFVTSTTYNGNLGGLAGADAKCQARADTANLGGTWKAWLSDGTVSAASRLNHSILPYKRLDGQIVASGWDDLVDGSLQNGINVTEIGSSLYQIVWTNSNFQGGLSASRWHCNNWTSENSNMQIGRTGAAGQKTFQWTDYYDNKCGQTAALYCFEQGGPISVTPTPGLKGDVNGDGKITLVDMSVLLSRWGKTGTEAGKADINLDGVVNTFDYSLLLQILIQNGVIKGSQELPSNLQLKR